MALLIEDFIEVSNTAKRLDELVSAYEKALAKQGFDKFIFSLMTAHEELQESAQHGVLVNYPQDWVEYYTQNDFFNYDPVVNAALKARSAFFWNDLQYEDSRAIKVMKEASDAGLQNGLAVPLRSRYQSLAAIGASSSEKEHFPRDTLSSVSLLSYQFYECYIKLTIKSHNIPKVDLSIREQDIIRYAAIGLTKAQIAEKLILSIHTVDFHIRKILLKTQSPNLLAAVVKAIRYEYIFF